MKDKHRIVRLRNKRLVKEIKELQKQFFGVFKSKDMQQLMAYSEDQDVVESFKRKKRLDDVCSKLDFALKKYNCYSIITLINADFENFYVASCMKHSGALDGVNGELRLLKYKLINEPLFFADIQTEKPFAEPCMKKLEELNITSVYALPIKNMSDNEIGFLNILLPTPKQYEHIKHLKEIGMALKKLKVVLTTSDVDIQEQRRSNSG